MDNLTTESRKKSTILEQMKIMEGIVKSLDAAGVDIIHLQVGKPENCYILLSLHSGSDTFRQWADENELNVIVEPLERKDETETDYGPRWQIGTVVNGIDVYSYFRDFEKEAWDHATV